MSRGPGRIERGILMLLALTPGHRLSRAQLEEALVEHKGYSKSNVLRAIRSLQRDHVVTVAENPDKSQAIVEAPVPKPVSNDKVYSLLHELGCARSQTEPQKTVLQGYSKRTGAPK